MAACLDVVLSKLAGLVQFSMNLVQLDICLFPDAV